ncbi:hypothetical protein [Paenibacillus aestuarii]|uniref:WYL domain-containing protein n=1 Tax=Paenibacillus aestuarii TaxID=516965 RepID=A0ABW0KHU8_9BACL|nr:hypothetical protein [Paenibacillus aestuarii]
MSDLLTVLSHHGDISFRELYLIIEKLYPITGISEQSRSEKFQIIKQLELLGHCEIDYEDKKVYCNPPFFGLLPRVGVYQALLAGARNTVLVNKLKILSEKYKNELNLLILKSSTTNIPDTIILESHNLNIIALIAKELKISLIERSPLAFLLINHSGNIEEYVADTKELALLNWEKRIFLVDNLFFAKKEMLNKSSTCQLEEYTAPFNQKKLYRLVKGDKGYQVTADWGRYLLLGELERQVLLYDLQNQIFAVPKSVPLPNLLARAANLCSGTAPSEFKTNKVIADIPSGCRMEQYHGVPFFIASKIAEKLGQTLEIVSLETK